MDFFSSQNLTRQDGYLHVFRQPGEYAYSLLSAGAASGVHARAASYRIEVTSPGSPPGEGEQHDVMLHWDPARCAYAPECATLTVRANDFVLWQIADAPTGAPPFAVTGARMERGRAEPELDSRALGTHDVYSHFFMSAGEYAYRIEGGGRGRLSVLDHRQMAEDVHAKRAADAVVILVRGGKPTPAHVEIVTGQTVLWAIEEGKGLSVVSELPGKLAAPGQASTAR